MTTAWGERLGRLAVAVLALCACSTTPSAAHRPATHPATKHADASSGAAANPSSFGNVPGGDGGQAANGRSPATTTGQPGGCVRPGELNEFHLPLCNEPAPMDGGRPMLHCNIGYDEFGRPVCLDDAGVPKPPPPPSCVRKGLCKQLVLAGSGQLDVLFMVDDSSSMGEEQQALLQQMPRLITVLTSGDVNDDGVQDFPAVKDLHLGVVSSDMGLPGVMGILGCTGLGNDGILRNTPATSVTGCAASYPLFLSYDASKVDPSQAATDFACIATLGTAGCGFEHPLESVLKAITPSSSDLRFLPDPPSAPAVPGHADGTNAGFLRTDSLVALVVITDEDDCSSRDTYPFTPPQYLNPGDPLAAQSMNMRCYYNKKSLFDIGRYVNGLQAIRPPGSNLVLFAAITGVPPDLVDATARAKVDFGDATARDAYYDAILKAPAMQETIDPSTAAPPGNENLTPSCDTATGLAYPPRRIVDVAKGFGENAVVQSICQSNFAPALAPIVERISASLTVGCLAKSFTRNAEGRAPCDVVWELPAPGTPGASLQLCEERPFLSTPDDRDLRTAADGRTRCIVSQVPVSKGDAGLAPAGGGSGWYYDDFSSEATDKCGGASHQRVVFTNGVQAPSDVRVYVDCDPTP